MIKKRRISICLPCRNEGNHLEKLISKIPDYVDEVIVVSNRSTDDTVVIAKRIGGRVKVFEDNREIDGIGYGFAHMTGINHATGDIIVCADGDSTYPIGKTEKIVGYLLDKELDFISCNRYPLKAGTKIPFKLRLGVSLLNLEVRLLYGVKIKDILSGMWVFRKNISRELNLSMGDWNLSPQIKLNAALNPKIKFEEFPISQYQRMGSTKQNYFKTGLKHAFWILRNRFSRNQILNPTSSQH